MPTSGTVVSNDGTRIAYEISGNGPTLVVVAGALGYKDFPYLRSFAAAFAKDFRVVAYDRRGRGGSSDTLPYSVEKEIDDLAAVCREAGDSPIVLGIASGAALALEGAARGVPMGQLVAFEAPYITSEHRKPSHAHYESEVSGFIARGDRDGALKLFMRSVGLPSFVVAIMRLMPFWKKLRPAAHTLPYDAAIMNGFELPSTRLGAIRVPAVVVGGGKSPAALKAAVRAVGDAVPGAQVVEIPKQSHAVKAHALSRVVQRFARASTRGGRDAAFVEAR
ncbi:MAG: alpha/beta hydrolase [Gemmatimonadota bacterium]|nr:alpha/beta hydrolase [Gemmatimonadota bacterium]